MLVYTKPFVAQARLLDRGYVELRPKPWANDLDPHTPADVSGGICITGTVSYRKLLNQERARDGA